MIHADDFKQALGSADLDFERRVTQTLTELQQNEEVQPMRKVKMGAVIAIALALIAAVALAATAQTGLWDFLALRGQEDRVLPEAQSLVQPGNGARAATGLAAITLTEGVYDGHNAYLVFEVKPLADDILLLAGDSVPSDPAASLTGKKELGETTVADWAHALGRDRVVYVSLRDKNLELGLESLISSLDYRLAEDGTLSIITVGPAEAGGQALDVALTLITYPVDGEREEADMAFTLNAALARGTAESAAPVTFADCGVEVTHVALTSTAMATYAEVRFRVVDRAAYAAAGDGLWFEFLDAEGQAIPMGVFGSGSIGEVEEGLGVYIQREVLVAMDALPATITLQGYNCWDKSRYEAHDIAMK